MGKRKKKEGETDAERLRRTQKNKKAKERSKARKREGKSIPPRKQLNRNSKEFSNLKNARDAKQTEMNKLQRRLGLIAACEDLEYKRLQEQQFDIMDKIDELESEDQDYEYESGELDAGNKSMELDEDEDDDEDEAFGGGAASSGVAA